MNKLLTSLLILALLLSGLSPAAAQKTNKKDTQFQEMNALIEGARYQFIVQSVQPTGGQTIQSTSGYTMDIKDSIYTADLPYFGRAYKASYGGDGGVKFEGTPENLEITSNEKKRTIKVQFEIRGKNDKYTLYLSAGYSGYASLSINSQNRQPISYSGIIAPLEEEEDLEEVQ
jgi:hypothetical protein